MTGRRLMPSGVFAGRLARGAIGLAFAIVVASCATTPPATGQPSASPRPVEASPGADCFDLPGVQAGECAAVVAAVREADPTGIGSAARVLVVPKCPPQVLCDSSFLYDLIVLLVPPGNEANPPVALHVFGHAGGSLQVAPWTDPLPEHVKALLTRP
jgi:hypothetical protein